ncbi:hypothetical protein PMNALOAF_3765 [Methylobacterium adhaesivum]|jgi:uncharacterized membrane protein|uniref:DUF1345 domain-containing protein n=1 Tax=Methylobacterium adhaesivum TaxID=333297 RepID=A0ABT8BL26_9HYPH|nr:DUF1345 domain-containing protein [Methylobacterium adhaesivum]MDN3591893.1 DUF1345 domain-containing protein [Methylobacterium adhaesivum]GJD32489.1 hypothetical protein PMNALOAF_3765 [Methylobacterium adhaesivum]
MRNPLRPLWLRPRLLGSLLLVGIIAAVVPVQGVTVRLLVGWCLGVVVYTGLITWQATRQDESTLRREASRLDDSAFAVSVFAILAAAASFGAVAMLVLGQHENEGPRLAHLGLAAATMLCAWTFVQVVFTVHYAHLYYGSTEEGGPRGGLDFNGDTNPDFWDFLYFSVTLGATSQTSDTAITSKRMRRVVTVQTLYAYLFNTSVLALAINMAAGVAQH